MRVCLVVSKLGILRLEIWFFLSVESLGRLFLYSAIRIFDSNSERRLLGRSFSPLVSLRMWKTFGAFQAVIVLFFFRCFLLFGISLIREARAHRGSKARQGLSFPCPEGMLYDTI